MQVNTFAIQIQQWDNENSHVIQICDCHLHEQLTLLRENSISFQRYRHNLNICCRAKLGNARFSLCSVGMIKQFVT